MNKKILIKSGEVEVAAFMSKSDETRVKFKTPVERKSCRNVVPDPAVPCWGCFRTGTELSHMRFPLAYVLSYLRKVDGGYTL